MLCDLYCFRNCFLSNFLMIQMDIFLLFIISVAPYFHIFLSYQGLAYQLIDDVLDFTGTSASLGKGSLSDIRHVIFLSFSVA